MVKSSNCTFFSQKSALNWLTIALLIVAALVSSSEPLVAQNETPKTYLGVASCASSSCHGGTTPRAGATIDHNEYNVWFRHDAHSKAYTTLLSEESKIIGKHLGITNPEKDNTCLQCHSTNVPKDIQGKKFRISDGVGCESCHGPSSSYIRSHAAKDRSYEDNIKDGLTDLNSLENRASVCLSCHLGNDQQFVNHRLIGAGHPRLRFELDTYGIIQPHHWRLHTNSENRKEKYDAARAWLTGQAVQARELVKAISSKTRSTQPGIPEFTNYYCYSCHHSLKEEQWKTYEYEGRPGELKRNTASLQILVIALTVLEKNNELQEGSVKKLHEALHAFENPSYSKAVNTNNSISSEKQLINILEEIIPSLKTLEFSKETSRNIMESIINEGQKKRFLPYEVAEQYAMGISAILSYLDPQKTLYQKHLKNIYETLSDEKEFSPERFSKALHSLNEYIRKSHE